MQSLGHRRLTRSRRAGAVLDVLLGVSLIVLGAFALDRLGLSFVEIVRGAGQFFGY